MSCLALIIIYLEVGGSLNGRPVTGDDDDLEPGVAIDGGRPDGGSSLQLNLSLLTGHDTDRDI